MDKADKNLRAMMAASPAVPSPFNKTWANFLDHRWCLKRLLGKERMGNQTKEEGSISFGSGSKTQVHLSFVTETETEVAHIFSVAFCSPAEV